MNDPELNNIEILNKILNKLTPQTWTYGSMARDINNKIVGALDDTACKWDIIGAIYSETVSFPVTPANKKYYEIVFLLKKEVSKTLKTFSLSVLNDTLGLDVITAIIKGAIHSENLKNKK